MNTSKFNTKVVQAAGSMAIPLAYAAVAVILGMAVPRIEAHLFPDLVAPMSANAAIALLASVASGMLPLTGLVFSLAFVLVQFSATAYSPRLVSWMAGSATLSHSLGIFTATFLYALAALAWIDRGGTGRVPLITVGVALLLLFVSMAFFVLLVRRVGSLQIANVLAYVGDQGRAVIERDYALLAGARNSAERSPAQHEAVLPAPTQTVVHRGGPAVVRAIDVQRLVALAEQEHAVVSLKYAVGDTLLDGLPLALVHGGSRPIPERKLRAWIRLGAERTFEQDPKYALRLLVDIAIKALSPAINDPTTAVQALDHVEDLMLRLSRRDLFAGQVRDSGGSLRLVFPVPDWDDFVVLAFDEIRYYGRDSIQVMRRMRALLQDLIENVPEERRPALERYVVRVNNSILRAFEDHDDRRDASEPDRQGLGRSGEPQKK
jgi:uncharacterized membrane protein